MNVIFYPILMLIFTFSLILRDSFALKALGKNQRVAVLATVAIVLAFALCPAKDDYKIALEVIATPVVVLILAIPIARKFFKIVG